MKILFIEPCYPDFGGYFRAINICSNLAKKGMKVDLLCSSKENSLKIVKRVYNPNLTIYELPRININYYIHGRLLRGIIAIFWGLFNKYDLIHTAVPIQLEANLPAFFLKFIGKKVVMDWDDLWYHSKTKAPKPVLHYMRWCEYFFPKYIKNIVVVSKFLEKIALSRGASNTLILINGVDTKQFKLQSKNDALKKYNLDPKLIYLLTVGNTYSYDRMKTLMETFEKIYNNNPKKIRLLFNFNMYKILSVFPDLDKKYSHKQFMKDIVNIGYIEPKDMGYPLAACSGVLLSLGVDDTERSCFPIRIGSYIQGEALIIVNDNQSEATNLLKKYNCAIVGSTTRDVASKASSILKNPKLITKYKANIKLAKKELAWEYQIDKLIKYYSQIV